MNDFNKKLDAYFDITQKGSTVKTEVMAGLATFLTMCYILIVNAGMIGGVIGEGGFNAIYIATAISAIIGTLMMGLYAKLPFAQAPGMGLNAFFTYTICFGMGIPFGSALLIVLISGLLFLTLTVVGVREKIVEGLPKSLKIAIPAGIGAFIAFIGMQNAGIIVSNPAVFVGLVDFTEMFSPANNMAAAHTAMSAFVCLVTFFAIVILAKKKMKGAIIIGLLGGTLFYYIMMLILFRQLGSYNPYAGSIESIDIFNPFAAFGDFGSKAFFQFSVSGLFTDASAVITFITLVISFAIVDMFDTIGTLVGTGRKANMLDKDGNLPNMKKALLCDSVATVAGATLGTSTVTTYVESAAGVSVGGKTGFTAVVVAGLFFVAMFLTPIAALIPSAATAAALIYVGVLMLGSVKDIEWDDPAVAAPCLMTILGMPLTYSIADGIGLGVITYVAIKLFTGKIKDVKLFTYIIFGLFLLKFFVL